MQAADQLIIFGGNSSASGSGGGPSYQGPGDQVASALAWVSPARAYSAAFAALAGPIMDIVDSGGINPATINILASGFVDLTTLNAWIVAHGTASVKKLYDHTGAGNHFTQATVANMPTIAQSALNSLPGMTFAAAQGLTCVNVTTQALPYTYSSVYKRTGAFTTQQALFGISGGSIASGPATAADTAQMQTALTAAAADSVFHAMQNVWNAAISTSILVIDGAAATGGPTGTALGTNPIRIGLASGAFSAFTGVLMEAGVWPIGFNATQYGNVNTNQHSAANGYNF